MREYFPGDDETKKLKRILSDLERDINILDVGCGYGGRIKTLREMGFYNILGVEINNEIVERDIERGLNVVSVREFWNSQKEATFDLIVMSHIIEHFQWHDLLEFLESYLDLLRLDGHLLIVTPLLHDLFFHDYDHVKPYYPTAIKQILGMVDAQVQAQSKHHLVLEKLYFRRSQISCSNFRSLYLNNRNKLPLLLHRFLKIMFIISCGIVGRKTGWIGLFRKVH